MKSIRKHKILSFFIIIFIGFNLIWSINYLSFKKPKENYGKGRLTYFKNIDGYTVSYKAPRYPTFTGNYAISTENDRLSLIVWPGNIFDSNKEYGLTIYDQDKNLGYLVSVDKDYRILKGKTGLSPEEEASAKELFDYNKKEIEKLGEVLESELE